MVAISILVRALRETGIEGRLIFGVLIIMAWSCSGILWPSVEVWSGPSKEQQQGASMIDVVEVGVKMIADLFAAVGGRV